MLCFLFVYACITAKAFRLSNNVIYSCSSLEVARDSGVEIARAFKCKFLLMFPALKFARLFGFFSVYKPLKLKSHIKQRKQDINNNRVQDNNR